MVYMENEGYQWRDGEGEGYIWEKKRNGGEEYRDIYGDIWKERHGYIYMGREGDR